MDDEELRELLAAAGKAASEAANKDLAAIGKAVAEAAKIDLAAVSEAAAAAGKIDLAAVSEAAAAAGKIDLAAVSEAAAAAGKIDLAAVSEASNTESERLRTQLAALLEDLRQTNRGLAASVKASSAVQQSITAALPQDRELFDTNLQAIRDRIHRTQGEMVETDDPVPAN